MTKYVNLPRGKQAWNKKRIDVNLNPVSTMYKHDLNGFEESKFFKAAYSGKNNQNYIVVITYVATSCSIAPQEVEILHYQQQNNFNYLIYAT